MTSLRNMLTLAALILLGSASLQARTITLTAEDCDQMAALSALAPRVSWAISQGNTQVFDTQPTIYWHGKIALLMRFPVADKIPKGQRITKAELTVGISYIAGAPSVRFRRVLAEWGPGVCHLYRMTYPKKVEWTQPGGLGASTDRADKDSAVFKFTKIGVHTVDLTEDIELWYTGAVANRGWILTLDQDGEHVYLPSPYAPASAGGKQWKLQITFEPQ